VLRNLVLTLLFLAAPPAAALEVTARAKACDADRKREGELQEGRCRALAGEAKKGSRERKKNVYMTAESRRTTSSTYGSFSLIGGSFRLGIPCRDFHCQVD
jgi:hypothetical protein